MRIAIDRIGWSKLTKCSGRASPAHKPKGRTSACANSRSSGDRCRNLCHAGTTRRSQDSVPAFVYVDLGTAYFRTEQWPDAEREFKAAIAVDPRRGVAFNNLAVLYLQTGRYKEAEEACEIGRESRLQGASAAETGHQSQTG